MKVYCIQKVRDASGKILYYAFKLENGNVITGTREDIINEMKTHKYGYEFTNLQLDKAGRLVDKSIKEVNVDENKQKALVNQYVQKAYEKMYKVMLKTKDGEQVKAGYIKYNRYTDESNDFNEDIVLYKYTYDILKKLNNLLIKQQCRDIDDIAFMKGFEEFLRSKNRASLKMTVDIDCKPEIQVVTYGIETVDFILYDEEPYGGYTKGSPEADVLLNDRKDITTIKTEILGKCNVDRNNYKLLTYYSDRFTKNGLIYAYFGENRFANSAREFIEAEKEADAKHLNQNKSSNKTKNTNKVNINKANNTNKVNKKMLTQEETQEIYRNATKLGRLVLKIKQTIRLFNMFS